MDIRKKGAICIFIYNVIGTISVCSLSTHNQALEGWTMMGIFLTLPISIFSFAEQFVYTQPLYYILSIQLVMLIISGFITDLILRNFSPAYIEKRSIKDIEKWKRRKEKALNGQITSEQVSIYLKYPDNINHFKEAADADERTILSIEQWFTIDNLSKDIMLIKKGQVSTSTRYSIETRAKENFRDQAAIDLLYTIE